MDILRILMESRLPLCLPVCVSVSLVFYFPSSITSFSLSFVFIHFEEQNTSSSSTHHDDDDDDHHFPSLFLLHKSSFPRISIRKSFSFQWFFSFKIGSELISMIKKIEERCSLIDPKERRRNKRGDFSHFLSLLFLLLLNVESSVDECQPFDLLCGLSDDWVDNVFIVHRWLNFQLRIRKDQLMRCWKEMWEMKRNRMFFYFITDWLTVIIIIMKKIINSID